MENYAPETGCEEFPQGCYVVLDGYKWNQRDLSTMNITPPNHRHTVTCTLNVGVIQQY